MKGKIYTFRKDSETDKMIRGSFRFCPSVSLEDIAYPHRDVSQSEKNPDRAYTVYRLYEGDESVQGTFSWVEDETQG